MPVPSPGGWRRCAGFDTKVVKPDPGQPQGALVGEEQCRWEGKGEVPVIQALVDREQRVSRLGPHEAVVAARYPRIKRDAPAVRSDGRVHCGVELLVIGILKFAAQGESKDLVSAPVQACYHVPNGLLGR